MPLGGSLLLAAGCAAGTLVYARRSIRKIELQTHALDKVSWHMLQSQEATARRFSHELHDERGQSLAAIKASLSVDIPEEAPWQRPADSIQLVDGAIGNVRFLKRLELNFFLVFARASLEGLSRKTGDSNSATR